MLLVVTLSVRSDAVDKFREFERKAVAVMARHNGVIERTVVLRSSEIKGLFREIHVLRFHDDAAYQAYQNDPVLKEAAHLREQSVVKTEILVGEDGPNYYASDC